MAPRKNPPRSKKDAVAAVLSIRIQPRASKNEVVLMDGGGLKIRLTAPPVDGAANEALVRFLADRLDIPKARVEIVSGHTGREKVIRILGMSEEQAKQLLIGEKE